jgi:iron complex outermembrane recepter protein
VLKKIQSGSFGLRAALVLLLAPPAVGVAPLAWAVESSAQLEEITVTARKRVETLQDAPVAITAISARQLEQYNITQMEDVASLAGGGVLISKNGVSPTLSIRGVSSDSTNAGFDQAVGIIIDGVFYDRSRWTQMGFFDTAQVEVLKGPQALYFGKSTVAGAIALTTASPGPTFDAKASLGYEASGHQTYGEAYISGPVSENVGMRLAVSASTMSGWLTNDAPVIGTNRFGGADEYTGRFTLAATPSDTVKLVWKVQANRTTDDGPATRAQLFNCRGPSPFGQTITGVQADTSGVYGAFYPAVDNCKLDNHITVYSAPPGLGYGEKPFTTNDSILSSLKVDWKLGRFDMTSVTGVNNYSLHEATGYIASQGLITAAESERNTGYSEELRALSNFDGPLNMLIGVNYAHTDFRFFNTSQIILAIPDPRDGNESSQAHVATQVGKSTSVFAELMWQISPQWQLSGGARYTDEHKDAAYNVDFVNQNFQTIFPFPFWLSEGTNLANNFKDTNVSPQATIEWKPEEGTNIFASYKTGFLPGGFSLGATPQAGLTLKDFLFESEKVKGYEIGIKKQLFDRSLSLDLVAYSYEFTNLQVNLYVPATASFVVGNAGEAKTRGVEFGARWRATDAVGLHTLATYNKGTFGDYVTSCYTLQTTAEGCNAGTQDVSGKPLPRAPKFTGSVGGTFQQPISAQWGVNFALDGFYSGKYQLEQSQNPYLTQGSYVRLDASMAFETVDNKWRIALFGRNLTNKAIATFGATRGFTNDELAEIQRLRTVNLQATHRF